MNLNKDKLTKIQIIDAQLTSTGPPTIYFPDYSVHLKYYVVVKYFLLCEHICDV